MGLRSVDSSATAAHKLFILPQGLLKGSSDHLQTVLEGHLTSYWCQGSWQSSVLRSEHRHLVVPLGRATGGTPAKEAGSSLAGGGRRGKGLSHQAAATPPLYMDPELLCQCSCGTVLSFVPSFCQHLLRACSRPSL